MKVTVPKGLYVVAVSGGVDSVVLLDLLSRVIHPAYHKLIVAHFDHGIRSDSHKDARFVEKLAKKYGFYFELGEERLGEGTSEEVARRARYSFLKSVQKKYKADGIILAHHKNDIIETMAINIARGTSPRGLISLRSTSKLLRPLLSYTKEDILSYAQEKKLTWQEDSTNTDTRYTRNRLRSKLANSDKAGDFEKIYHRLSSVYKELDQLLAEQERAIIEGMIINRTRFLTLPFSVGCELLARFFGRIGVDNIDQQLIVNAAVAVRTYKQGKKFDLDRNYYLASEKKQVVVHRRTI